MIKREKTDMVAIQKMDVHTGRSGKDISEAGREHKVIEETYASDHLPVMETLKFNHQIIK